MCSELLPRDFTTGVPEVSYGARGEGLSRPAGPRPFGKRFDRRFDKWFDKWFDKLTTPSGVEGLTVPSERRGTHRSEQTSKGSGQARARRPSIVLSGEGRGHQSPRVFLTLFMSKEGWPSRFLCSSLFSISLSNSSSLARPSGVRTASSGVRLSKAGTGEFSHRLKCSSAYRW